ncbi:MAG: hypothetical protein LUD73_02525 [Lachnospiraceae bacterium]|nr:hypothetical protein [Lachnospiraceae bacterium]
MFTSGGHLADFIGRQPAHEKAEGLRVEHGGVTGRLKQGDSPRTRRPKAFESSTAE